MTYESLDALSELFGIQAFSYAYLSLGSLAEIVLVMMQWLHLSSWCKGTHEQMTA